MTDCVLGLDGGGTKIAALVLGMDGAVRGEGVSGPCNIAAMPPPAALAAALAAANMALARAGTDSGTVRAVCAGVAGFSHGERREQFRTGLGANFPEADVSVQPDYAIALTGATGGAPGIVVVAGTGSVAYGENAHRAAHRAGAYGYLIDDGGSGYGVGRAALAAVLRAADGTGEATTLTDHLSALLGLASVADILPAAYGGPLDRPAIAALAPVVASAAREDRDPVALSILMHTGGSLARLAEAVAGRLFRNVLTSYPVVSVGSLWNAGPPLTDVFARSLARFAPAAVLTPPHRTPVEGAALRALAAISPGS